MRGRAAVACVGLIALGAVIGATARAAEAAHERELCGVERWTVKTLQDRPRRLPTRTVSLRFLVTRPAPAELPYRRLPFERHVYRVVAAVVLIRPEDDGDFHLILRDRGLSMIAETPMVGYTSRATPIMRAKMQAARRAARVCARAAVTGVAFFDYEHGQTGVAPNAIELHPVLGFRCLSSRASVSPSARRKCAASYPDVCIPPPPPDLDCSDIPYRNFRVLWNVPNPDPHHFDGNHNGIGCQS